MTTRQRSTSSSMDPPVRGEVAAAACFGAECRPTSTARVLNVGNHRIADEVTP